MSDGKRSVKAVVLDDGAASLRRADGADVGHAEGVAGVVAAEILDRRDTVSLNEHFDQNSREKRDNVGQ